MSSVLVRREKYRSSAIQPLDRHLSEVDKLDGTIYINAGIDSTCCKKQSRILHTLTDGIVVTSPTSRSSTRDNDDLSPVLSHDRCDAMIINNGCLHCGK